MSMRHISRSSYRKQEREAINSYYSEVNEAKILKIQIDRAWEKKEQEEKDKIQKETYYALQEYDALIHSYDDEEADIEKNTAIEIKEYFKSLDDAIETEGAEPQYKKDKRRLSRRKAIVSANKRLLTNAEITERNFQKRSENDNKNHLRKRKKRKKTQGIDLRNLAVYHTNPNYKSRVVRCNNLQKKASKFQH